MSDIKLTTRLLGLADGKEEWGENRTEINILREAARRIAELEAERDRLRGALEIIRAGETLDPRRAADAALSPTPSGDISRGEAYAYRSEDHGPGKNP